MFYCVKKEGYINRTVYAKDNIGIVLNTDFTGGSLIEYLAKNSDTGIRKYLNQGTKLN